VRRWRAPLLFAAFEQWVATPSPSTRRWIHRQAADTHRAATLVTGALHLWRLATALCRERARRSLQVMTRRSLRACLEAWFVVAASRAQRTAREYVAVAWMREHIAVRVGREMLAAWAWAVSLRKQMLATRHWCTWRLRRSLAGWARHVELQRRSARWDESRRQRLWALWRRTRVARRCRVFQLSRAAFVAWRSGVRELPVDSTGAADDAESVTATSGSGSGTPPPTRESATGATTPAEVLARYLHAGASSPVLLSGQPLQAEGHSAP